MTKHRPLLIALATLAAGCTVFGIRSGYEQPGYETVDRVGSVEIRSYGARLVAQTIVEADDELAALRGRRIAAFAGIARPSKFFDPLREAGADVVAAIPFPDHHAYSPRELIKLLRAAGDAQLATTPKDAVRLLKQRCHLVDRLPQKPGPLEQPIIHGAVHGCRGGSKWRQSA